MVRSIFNMIRQAYLSAAPVIKKKFEEAIVKLFNLSPELLKNPGRLWAEIEKKIKDPASLRRFVETSFILVAYDQFNDHIMKIANIESKHSSTGDLAVTNYAKAFVDRYNLDKDKITNDPSYGVWDYLKDNWIPWSDGPVEKWENYNKAKRDLQAEPSLSLHDSGRVSLSEAFHTATAMKSKLNFVSRVLRVDQNTALKFILDLKTIDESYSFLVDE